MSYDTRNEKRTNRSVELRYQIRKTYQYQSILITARMNRCLLPTIFDTKHSQRSNYASNNRQNNNREPAHHFQQLTPLPALVNTAFSREKPFDPLLSLLIAVSFPHRAINKVCFGLQKVYLGVHTVRTLRHTYNVYVGIHKVCVDTRKV